MGTWAPSLSVATWAESGGAKNGHLLSRDWTRAIPALTALVRELSTCPGTEENQRTALSGKHVARELQALGTVTADSSGRCGHSQKLDPWPALLQVSKKQMLKWDEDSKRFVLRDKDREHQGGNEEGMRREVETAGAPSDDNEL